MEHTFKINSPLNSADSSIEMDGVPLHGVVRASFDLTANSLTTMRLEIIGHVIVEGEFLESEIVKVERPYGG